MKQNKIEAYLAFCAIVLIAVFMRLLPHIPNVAPIAALALFSGVMITGWGAFLIPLLAMGISDYFIGFHNTIPFVYGSFLLIAGIGFLIRKKASPLKIALGSLSGSFLFFIITNFGVWTTSTMYEKSVTGLINCYGMGLPFFRNTIIGDMFYVGIFFFGFKVLKLLFILMLPSAQKVNITQIN